MLYLYMLIDDFIAFKIQKKRLQMFTADIEFCLFYNEFIDCNPVHMNKKWENVDFVVEFKVPDDNTCCVCNFHNSYMYDNIWDLSTVVQVQGDRSFSPFSFTINHYHPEIITLSVQCCVKT